MYSTHFLDEQRKREQRDNQYPRTVGDDEWLIGWAEAEVVQNEQGGLPVLRQVCQQLQGSAHPEDALLAVLCKREIEQQLQPQAQQAPAAAAATGGERGFASP